MTVSPCTHSLALEVVVIGESGGPVKDVLVELRNAAGKTTSNRSDAAGLARFEGVGEGELTLALPSLDIDVWELVATEALPSERAAASGAVTWADPPARETPSSHEVLQGDCLSSIAFRYGYLAPALWDANAVLKKKRKSMNVLEPGDAVALPPMRASEVKVTAGNLYRVRRKSSREMLLIRFVDFDDQPRAGLSFHVAIRTADGAPFPDSNGTTTTAGLLEASIPPDAVAAVIILGKPPDAERYVVRLGALDPIDTISGLRERLRNLGYDCGTSRDAQLDPPTKAALEQFQRDHALTVTGANDVATQGKLEELHLS